MIGFTSTCTASFSRNDEWKRCCAVASGFEFVDCFDDDDADDDNDNDNDNDIAMEIDDHNIFQVTNLLHDDDDIDVGFEDDDDDGYKEVDIEDAWTVNAFRISSDLNRMSHWIQSKKQKYVGLDMKDDEAALIQSTITSFAATTATELETLRNMIKSYDNTSVMINNNLTNHRSGIVQILLDQLQLQVTKPFGILQKQRTRVAVQLWQNPLQCKLYQPKRRTRRSQQPQDLLFDDEDDENDQLEHHEEEQRFLPKRSYHHQEESNNNNGYDFISKYANKQPARIPTEQPDFLIRILKRQECMGTETNETETTMKEQIVTETSDIFPSSFSDNIIPQNFQSIPSSLREHQPAAIPMNNTNNTNEYYQQQLEEELHTESVQLATILVANNDLDSVQQMETRMVEITTLIGQFSNLVQDQQEQIVQVHESAKETKDNLDKGQENLIDAAERTKRSKHYKACLIFSMALILMFFHLLRN
jgi:hypothetical protein